MQSKKIFLAFTLILSVCYSLSIKAEVWFYSSNTLNYYVDTESQTANVADYRNTTATSYEKKEIEIPRTILYGGKEFKVIGIGDNAFKDNENLEKIIFHDNIQFIGKGAFTNCQYIKNIDLPVGLKYIDDEAFKNCLRLQSISFPDSMESIGSNAFYGCNYLTSITLPQRIIEIKDAAFSWNVRFEQINYKGGEIRWKQQLTKIGTNNKALLNAVVNYVNGPIFEGEVFEYCGINFRIINIEKKNVEIIKRDRCEPSYKGNLTIPASFVLDSVSFTLSGIAPNAFANCPDLQSIHFNGTKVRWNKLEIGVGNDVLNNIPIYFDYNEDSFLNRNQLYWERNTCTQNSTTELKLKLRNENSICSFQFKMTLPKELTICSDNNKESISFCYDRFTQVSHNISEITKLTDGSYLVICTSSSNNIIVGNDGTILTMKVNIGNDVKNSEYNIDFADITIIDESSKPERLSHLQLPIVVTNVDLSELKFVVESAIKYKSKIEEFYPYEASRLEEVILLASDVINNASATIEQVSDALNTLSSVLTDIKNVVPLIFISNQPKYMVIGDVVDLRAVVTEDGQDESDLIWSVANEEIASITTDGVITAKAKGTAKIAVKTNSENSIFAEAEIKIWYPIVAQGKGGDNITWTLHSDNTIVFTGSGNMNQYSENTVQVGSSTIGGLAPWYSYKDRIKEVYIDPQIRSIGSYAFYQCTALENVELSEVQVIEKNSFRNCAKLNEVRIPNTVKSIGGFAFAYCGIDTLILPNSISFIEPSAFRSCSLLKHIELGEGLRSIESAVFAYCGLDTLKIPNTVEYIQESAFMYCTSLKHIELGGGLKTIGKNALQNTTALEAIIHKAMVPPTISDIGNRTAINYVPAESYEVYKNTTLSNIVSIPTSIEFSQNELSLETGEFYTPNVSIFPDDGSNHEYTLWYDNTKMVLVSSNIFFANKQGSANITAYAPPYNISSILQIDAYGSKVVDYGSISSSLCYTLLSNGTARIGGYGDMNYWQSNSNKSPFSADILGKKVKSLIIGDEVANIAYRTVDYSPLSYVSIGKGTEKINENAFYQCPEISQVVMYCHKPPIASNCGFPLLNCTLFVPHDTKSLYAQNEYWRNFNIVEMGSEKYCITFMLGDNIYCKRNYFEGEPLKAIAPSTEDDILFTGWIDLPEIMPNQDIVVHGYFVEGSSAQFEIHADKKTIEINEELLLTTSFITNNILYDDVKWSVSNTKIAQVTNDGILTMYENGQVEVTAILINNYKAIATASIQIQCSEVIKFQDQETKKLCITAWDINKDNELSIYEAELVTSVSNVFDTKRSIKYFDEFEYFTNVTSISKNAFRNCDQLVSIKLPSSIKSIGDYTFSGCSYLNSINIPVDLTSIGSNAFSGCYRLYDIIIESTNFAEMAFTSSKNLATIFGTQIKNVVFCNGIKTVGNYAMRSATNIESIEFPSSIESIGEYLLSNNSKLKRITINAPIPPSLLETSFKSVPFETTELFVPYGSGEVYEATNIWNQFKNIYEIGRKIECISLSLNELELAERDTTFITATVDSKYIHNKEIVWNSSDKNIASINSDGRIIGITQGVTTITATAIDGGVFADCIVTVTETDILNRDYTNITQLEDAVYMEKQEYKSGDTFCIPINLKNKDLVKQLTLDIYLPEALVVSYDEDEDEYAIELSTERTSYRKHALISELIIDSKGHSFYHIELISLKGSNIDGNDGPLFSISGKIAKNMKDSIYPIVFRNVEFEGVKTLKVKDTKYQLVITSIIQGDVNRDSKVNVTDAIDIINDRLGYESENFDRSLSDVNQDSQYTIADATAVINIMYGEPIGNPSMARNQNCQNAHMSAYISDRNMLYLNMETDCEYSAFEFDIELPEGMMLDGISLNESRCKDFAVQFNKTDNNLYKVVAYNLANEPLANGSDNLLTLNLSGANESDEVRLTNIHFSTLRAIDVLFDDLSLSMTTGIESHTVSTNEVKYNITGTRVNKDYRGIVIANGKKTVRK